MTYTITEEQLKRLETVHLLLAREIRSNRPVETPTSYEIRFTHDEKLQMVENMRKYGGSFVKALAECFVTADGSNLDKLINTFPEYVKQYLEWGK